MKEWMWVVEIILIIYVWFGLYFAVMYMNRPNASDGQRFLRGWGLIFLWPISWYRHYGDTRKNIWLKHK